MKLKKNDSVIVISGSDKGREGVVKDIHGERVTIQGVNMVTKHLKAQNGQKGSVVKVERSIHISNVSYCIDGKPVKLRVKVSPGKRELVSKSKHAAEQLIRTL